MAGVSEFSGVGVSGGVPQLDQIADLVNAAGATVAPELAVPVTGQNELAITCAGGSNSGSTWTVTGADPDSGGTWTPITYVAGLGAAYQIGPASLTQFKATWTASGGTNCEGMISTYVAAAIAKSGTDTNTSALEGTPKTGVNDSVDLQ